MADESYAGDIDPGRAWDMLRDDTDACLIDVRTEAEWRYVGVPDLASIGKRTELISWQIFPDNRLNGSFVDDVSAQGIQPTQTVLLLCRSGQRSRAAAIALTAAGYLRCFNVAEGFEGDKNAAGHRGTVGGWKIGELPWTQG